MKRGSSRPARGPGRQAGNKTNMHDTSSEIPTHSTEAARARGILITALGVLILSSDAVLIRLIAGDAFTVASGLCTAPCSKARAWRVRAR